MGGSGSTRWGWHRKKRTVEGCRHFTVKNLFAGKPPTPGRTGTLTWDGGASIGYTITPGPAVRLNYSIPPPSGERQPIEYAVPVVAGKVPNGGAKWWFRCPLSVNGKPCGRRTGTLFLPPGQTYFGCRTCHRLAYRSCQTHDNRVSRLAKNPDALCALNPDLTGYSPAQLGLLLSALTMIRQRADRELKKLK